MKTIGKRTGNIISVILLAAVFAAAPFLSSCIGMSAKSEKEILRDIKSEVDDFYTDYGLTVDSWSIEKRQTNKNDKTDYVWIDVTASNNDMTYRASYYLYYVLYNDGWLLEDWDREYSSYTAKHPEGVKPSEDFPTKNEDYQTNIPVNKPCRLADNADLLTDDEEKELISLLDKLSLEKEADIVIVTADELDDKMPQEYADDYFDYNNYGFGARRDGILFLRSLNPKYVYISTSGSCIERFSDEILDSIFDAIEADITSGNYMSAFRTFLSYCSQILSY